MKALTVSQPFAELIASGEKWIENRGWGTGYRGRLAIHAGRQSTYLDPEDLRHYQTGCVVAVAMLAACVPLSGIHELRPTCPIRRARKTVGEILAHGHCEGPWLWILTHVRRLVPPIPARGAQGLWDWDYPAPQCATGPIDAALRQQIKQACKDAFAQPFGEESLRQRSLW